MYEETRIEGYWDGELFVPTAINGRRIRPLKGIPSEEIQEFRRAAAFYGRYVKTDWNKRSDKSSSGLVKEWDAASFARVMAVVTQPELLLAKILWNDEPLWNEQIATKIGRELGIPYDWRKVNGIESGWTRMASSRNREPLFDWADKSGKWRIVPKYKHLFDSYFKP